MDAGGSGTPRRLESSGSNGNRMLEGVKEFSRLVAFKQYAAARKLCLELLQVEPTNPILLEYEKVLIKAIETFGERDQDSESEGKSGGEETEPEDSDEDSDDDGDEDSDGHEGKRQDESKH